MAPYRSLFPARGMMMSWLSLTPLRKPTLFQNESSCQWRYMYSFRFTYRECWDTPPYDWDKTQVCYVVCNSSNHESMADSTLLVLFMWFEVYLFISSVLCLPFHFRYTTTQSTQQLKQCQWLSSATTKAFLWLSFKPREMILVCCLHQNEPQGRTPILI
jgi:hypothetical protein